MLSVRAWAHPRAAPECRTLTQTRPASPTPLGKAELHLGFVAGQPSLIKA